MIMHKCILIIPNLIYLHIIIFWSILEPVRDKLEREFNIISRNKTLVNGPFSFISLQISYFFILHAPIFEILVEKVKRIYF